MVSRRPSRSVLTGCAIYPIPALPRVNLTPRYHIVPTLPQIYPIRRNTGPRRIRYFYL